MVIRDLSSECTARGGLPNGELRFAEAMYGQHARTMPSRTVCMANEPPRHYIRPAAMRFLVGPDPRICTLDPEASARNQSSGDYLDHQRTRLSLQILG